MAEEVVGGGCGAQAPPTMTARANVPAAAAAAAAAPDAASARCTVRHRVCCVCGRIHTMTGGSVAAVVTAPVLLEEATAVAVKAVIGQPYAVRFARTYTRTQVHTPGRTGTPLSTAAAAAARVHSRFLFDRNDYVIRVRYENAFTNARRHDGGP